MSNNPWFNSEKTRKQLLFPGQRGSKPMQRAASDDIVKNLQGRGAPKVLGLDPEDERGVHGGEYSVRPNMQESMVFLRKLFTHQHEGKSFPNLLSLPDSPMREFVIRPCCTTNSSISEGYDEICCQTRCRKRSVSLWYN
jgi:hypothetical protein